MKCFFFKLANECWNRECGCTHKQGIHMNKHTCIQFKIVGQKTT